MEVVSVDMLFSSFTCHIPRSRSDHYYGTLDDTLYFEERLEKREAISWRFGGMSTRTCLKIINLPCDDQEEHDALNDRPPLDTGVRRLGGVPVSPLSNQDILLLVFYGLEVVS